MVTAVSIVQQFPKEVEGKKEEETKVKSMIESLCPGHEIKVGDPSLGGIKELFDTVKKSALGYVLRMV